MKLSELENKRIAIWGLGVEGQAVLEFLKKNFPEQPVLIIDDDKVPQNVDIIVRSPGVSIYREDIKKAIQDGVKFTSLINIFLAELKNQENPPKVIAVSGTKGKSTTTSLIAHMLEHSGYRVGLGGNIGFTPLEFLNKKLDYVILELSSFQISDLREDVDVAVLINLSRAHVDWHLTFDNYMVDKCRILGLAKKVVINESLKDSECVKAHISRDDEVTWYDGAKDFHVKNSKIFDGENEVVLPSLHIMGDHNLSNICAALTVLKLLNLDRQKAIQSLGEFKSLAHRLEKVYEKDGLVFVDDSIATVPESVMAAVNAFKGQDIALIIGGYDNGQMDYANLSRFIEEAKDVKTALCLPDTGSMLKTSKSVPVENMEQAVKAAVKSVKKGVVLLSPAAPSFNMYKNYKERGLDFARLAKEVME